MVAGHCTKTQKLERCERAMLYKILYALVQSIVHQSELGMFQLRGIRSLGISWESESKVDSGGAWLRWRTELD